ncbi:MAG: M23 family metallopeptidase [Gemmatimonadetes bacterium]|nr:M23 family metallopeptidase [Gemmatimonadota bacterium]
MSARRIGSTEVRGARVAFLVAFAALPVAAPEAAAQPAPSGTGPAVVWAPDRPSEGELFTVRVTPAAEEPILLLVGTAGDEPLHFERTEDGAFESLAAVPLGVRSTLSLTVSTFFGDGREEPAEYSVPITPGVYNHRRLTVAPELGSPPTPEQAARRAREAERAAEVSANAHRTPRLWSGEVILPKPVQRVTSGFGDGRIFNGQVSSQHTGLDLDGVTGDTVYAAARGVAELVDLFELAGNMVYINHGGGLVTAYFHLSQQLVAAGDTVEVGQPIGRVGATGRVTGPHLHWVVRYGQTSVDPRSLIELTRSPSESAAAGN